VIQTDLILNGRPVQSGAVDNGLATATAAAIGNIRHFVCGIDADYSVTLGAGVLKTVTLKINGVAVFVWRWEFNKGPFMRNIAVPFHGDYNQPVSVELEASGTGGTTGRVGFWVADS
jgi:hypothetical protein